MKTIPNKAVTFADKPGLFSDMLKAALDFPPERGFDPSTIRARARLDVVLKDAKEGGELIFEDADYETAKTAIAACRWATRSTDHVALFDAFGIS